jgi:hypothetical protein
MSMAVYPYEALNGLLKEANVEISYHKRINDGISLLCVEFYELKDFNFVQKLFRHYSQV